MTRGQSVTGYWALFPASIEEPKRFVDEQDAMEFWPEVKTDSVYVPAKVVFRVTWNMDTDLLLGKRMQGVTSLPWPERGGDVKRSGFRMLTNPLSYEGFKAKKEDLQQEALDKKRAKKNAGRDPEWEAKEARLDAVMAAGARKRAADKARRREFAEKRRNG